MPMHKLGNWLIAVESHLIPNFNRIQNLSANPFPHRNNLSIAFCSPHFATAEILLASGPWSTYWHCISYVDNAHIHWSCFIDILKVNGENLFRCYTALFVIILS